MSSQIFAYHHRAEGQDVGLTPSECCNPPESSHLQFASQQRSISADGLFGQGFHKDLHPTSKLEDMLKSRLLLDVVIDKNAYVLKLLSSKDQLLQIRWNPLLVLDLGLDIVNCVRTLNFQGNCLLGQGLDKDLHPTSKTEDNVKSGFLLDVVVGKSASIFQMLTSKDETLLVWWNSLFVLNLGLYIVDGIRALHLKAYGLTGQGLHEYLHL